MFFQPVDEHEKKPERPSCEREMVVGGDKKSNEPVRNDVPPFRKQVEEPGKHERRNEEGKNVPDEEIRVDSEFSRKLVEHSEKKQERNRQRDSEGVDGYPEREFDLGVHAGF